MWFYLFHLWIKSCSVIIFCKATEHYYTVVLAGPCKAVKCTWRPWSDWSATCGYAERTRTISSTQIVVQQQDCSGLPQTCSQPPQKESRKTMCACPTVTCSWNQWSEWSASCGKATRKRTIQTIKVCLLFLSHSINVLYITLFIENALQQYTQYKAELLSCVRYHILL